MYTPPNKHNWNYNIAFCESHAQCYKEGYQAAADRVMIWDNPYDKVNYLSYFWYKGYVDKIEWE